MRLIYADPGLSDQTGHHMNTCRSLMDALRARNIEHRLLASDRAEHVIQAELGAVPWFHYKPYLTDGDPICGHAYLFHTGMQICWQDLSRIPDIGANDVLFLPWAMAAQFCATILWMNALNPDRRPLVIANFLQVPEVLYETHEDEPKLRLPDYRQEPSAMFLRLAARLALPEVLSRLELRYTDPRGAKVLNAVFGLNVEQLPPPQHATTDCHRRKADGQITIGLLGQQRGYVKGIQHVPELARALLASSPNIRFVIHSSTAPRPLIDILGRLPQDEPRLSVLLGAVDGDAWSRLLDSIDLMVCPYSPGWYRFGTSGIHNEAIANAIPAVVPADTTLSIMSEQFCGSSVAFGPDDWPSILRAIQSAIDNFDHHSERAHRGAIKWREVNGPDKTVDALLATAERHGLA